MYELWDLGLGFLEGFALIISPCILPILPIMLAGSLTGSKKRPLGIIFGFILVFSLFTFFSRKLVEYSGIDLNLLRHLSYALLFLLGCIMVSNFLTEKFAKLTARFAGIGANWKRLNQQEDFLGGLLFGGLVAIIWTPCAGPILAAVIVQTVTQQTTVLSFLIVFAFATGAALPMLLIAFFGRRILPHFNFFKTRTLLFRKLLGFIILATVAYMIYFENSLTQAGAAFEAAAPATPAAFELQKGLALPYPAPALDSKTDWINSEPLQLSNLKGKVVLIDFWTYSCINCIRTLPYLKDWYRKYHDQGLIIIGVHSPEFDFEKKLSNVKAAVAADGILYPVTLDNQYVTWRNYNNQYWPAHYLIDKEGQVVYTHFGEGDYEVTENNIRYLLGLKAGLSGTTTLANGNSGLLTPETYFGYARSQRFASPETITTDRPALYHFPQDLRQNDWALQGLWTIAAEGIVSASTNSSLRLHFLAQKVFIVLGSTTGQPILVHLLLNGKPLGPSSGKDVVESSIQVTKPRLYEALTLPAFGEGILEVQPAAPQLEIYTFTFG